MKDGDGGTHSSGQYGELGKASYYIDSRQALTDSESTTSAADRAARKQAEEIRKASEIQAREERLKKFALLDKPKITPEQFVWLNIMSQTGDLTSKTNITPENYGTYYLFKDPGKPLKGGYLFNFEKKNIYIEEERNSPGHYENRYQIDFFDPEEKKDILNSKYIGIFELPNILPTTAPSTVIFRRLIDVDDTTGEMIFYNKEEHNDNNQKYKPEDNIFGGWKDFCIVEVDPETKNHVVMDETSLYDRDTLQFLTGKVITQSLVEKMCGKPGSSEGKKEIYVKFVLPWKSTPERTKKTPLSDSDIKELEKAIELSKDAMETQGSKLCVTRSKPIEKVLGPPLIDLVHIPDGCPQRIRFENYYIKIGEFSVKVDITPFKRGENPEDKTGNIKIDTRAKEYSITIRYDRKKIFITEKEKYAYTQRNDKAIILLHKNLKLRTDPNPAKVDDVFYFYKTEDKTRQYPLIGRVCHVVKIENIEEKKYFFSKNTKTITYTYDVNYINTETGEQLKETGVTQLYERNIKAEEAEAEAEKEANTTSGGKKNRRSVRRKQRKRKTNIRKKTRRGGLSSIPKSIKRKMRTKKSRRH